MLSLQDEIRKAQQELTCPVCGRMFELRDIHIRAYEFNKAVELSVTCSRGHFPIILLVPLALKDLVNAGPITQSELKMIHSEVDSLETTLEKVFS
ncbi:MAG: hypothetical protein AAB774_01625 [Patescibacteria group bacterium]